MLLDIPARDAVCAAVSGFIHDLSSSCIGHLHGGSDALEQTWLKASAEMSWTADGKHQAV